MRKIYVILVEYRMKLTLLFSLKGSNYYKHVEKAYNFRIKSGIGKWNIGNKFSDHFTMNVITLICLALPHFI